MKNSNSIKSIIAIMLSVVFMGCIGLPQVTYADVGRDVTSSAVTEANISPETVEHGGRVDIEVKFSDAGVNEGFKSGDTINIGWTNGNMAQLRGYSYEEDLSENGKVYAHLSVTANGATVTFNEEVENMEKVSGGFFFKANAALTANDSEEHTDTVTLNVLNGKTVTVHKPAGVIGSDFFSKNGDLDNTDTSYGNYVIHANWNKEALTSDLVIVDTLGDGMIFETDETTGAPNINLYWRDGVSPSDVHQNMNTEQFANRFPGASFVINGKTLTITIPREAVSGYGISINYRTVVTDTSIAKFTNTAEATWSDAAGNPASESKNWDVNNVDAGGHITGVPKGQLQVTKLVEGTDTPVEGFTFVITKENDDNYRKEITTGKDGKAIVTGVTLGTYTIKELNGPAWIEVDTNASETVVFAESDTEGKSVTFYDSVKNKEVSITKSWRDFSNTYNSRPTAEEYASYVSLFNGDTEITDVEPTVVDNSNDTYTVTYANLPAYTAEGESISYTVKETAVAGYEADNSTVVEDGEITNSVKTSEAREDSKITINKVDEDGEILDGATFVLSDSEGNEIATYEGGTFEISTLDRELSNLLPAAGQNVRLTLKETDAPEGYVASNEEYVVSISASASSEFINDAVVTTISYKISLTDEENEILDVINVREEEPPTPSDEPEEPGDDTEEPDDETDKSEGEDSDSDIVKTGDASSPHTWIASFVGALLLLMSLVYRRIRYNK